MLKSELLRFLGIALVLLVSSCYSEMNADVVEKINGGLEGGTGVIEFISGLGDAKSSKVFNALGKMAGFLGAAGGLVSFALLFLPTQSEELAYMKKKFAEVNMKLDRITTELDNIKALIKYENQRSVYVTSASKILFGHKKLMDFLNEIQKTRCSGKNACKRIRARIASRYVRYFDVKHDIFKIINGALKPISAFGDPLLKIVKTTFKCDVGKIDHLSNSILKLAFKAQQVILIHEKLTGSKHSIVQSMDDWLKSVYRLRDATEKVKGTCYKNIKNYMINDINDKKYQVGVSSNEQANKELKAFLDGKYKWLGWIVYSYGAYGGSKHWVRNNYGKFWSMPKDQNKRKRNIIVGFVDKSGIYRNQKYKVMNAIDDMTRKTDFYKERRDASKILPKIVSELQKRSVWKYINTINVLRKYQDMKISGDNDLSYINEEYSIYSVTRSKRYANKRVSETIRIVITLKSEEKAAGKKCSLACNSQGTCVVLPYSSKQHCQCKPYYQGEQCKDHAKVQLAKTMDAMLKTTLKLPMLSDIKYDIENLREFVGVSLGKLQTAVSKLEATFQKALNQLAQKLKQEFKWSNLITHYSNSIRKINYYSYLFEKLPKLHAKIRDREGRRLASALLKSDGVQKWLYELNFLFLGRSGTPLISHQPLMILFMDKYKGKSCSKRYKSAVNNSWKQLVLLQQVGYMLWSQALEYSGKDTSAVVIVYKKRTNDQVAVLYFYSLRLLGGKGGVTWIALHSKFEKK